MASARARRGGRCGRGRGRARPGRSHPQRWHRRGDGGTADRARDLVRADAGPRHQRHLPGRRPADRGLRRRRPRRPRRLRRRSARRRPVRAAQRRRHGPAAARPRRRHSWRHDRPRRARHPAARRPRRRRSGAGGFGGPGGGGAFGGNSASLTSALAYIKANGGGTLAVSSQSTAAAAIIFSHADVAGIGGFSGRESAVTPAWLASEVAAGKIRWVLADGDGGGGLRNDGRTGSTTAMAAVAVGLQVRRRRRRHALRLRGRLERPRREDKWDSPYGFEHHRPGRRRGARLAVDTRTSLLDLLRDGWG